MRVGYIGSRNKPLVLYLYILVASQLTPLLMFATLSHSPGSSSAGSWNAIYDIE